MRSGRSLVAFFGHHKCATTWIHRILSDVCRIAGLTHHYLARPRDFDGDLRAFIEGKRVDAISYVNSDSQHVSALSHVRGFHVVRDPRDLLVSAYFSHLHSHPTHDWPELEPHRERLRSLSKQEGLLLELEFSSEILEQIRAWDYDQPNVLELRQEDLVGSPYKGFLQVFDFLGLLSTREYRKEIRLGFSARTAWNSCASRLPVLPHWRIEQLPAERLLGIVYEHRFSKLTGGRARGVEDTESHYRKGVPGDWRNHFDDSLTAIFKGRHNDLLVQLGYESDEDWRC